MTVPRLREFRFSRCGMISDMTTGKATRLMNRNTRDSKTATTAIVMRNLDMRNLPSLVCVFI